MKNIKSRHLREWLYLGLLLFSALSLRVQAVTPTAAFTTLQSFHQSIDGVEPISELVQDPSGNFYGTCYRGGQGDNGIVYKRTPGGTQTILFDFFNDDKAGTNPQAGLLYSTSDGNFYGTTSGGGTSGGGTFFKLTPAGALTTLYSFTPGTDGAGPVGTLVQGADGNLYGVCSGGGPNSGGTIYKITKSGGFTRLHAFGGAVTVGSTSVPDGQTPVDSLLKGSDNNLYGICETGGSGRFGIAFSVTPTGSAYSILHAFGSGDGLNPSGALVEISSGVFAGVTDGGGNFSAGTIYRVSSSSTYAKTYDFNPAAADVAFPVGRLTRASDGLYYGQASGAGPNGGGGIFRTTGVGGEVVVLAYSPSLDQYQDANAVAGLTLGSDQLLYGVMQTGGSNGQGAIFNLTTNGATTILYNFSQGGNSRPLAGLAADAAGDLLGTTYFGGTSNGGTIFEISTAGQFNTVFNFDGLPDATNAFTVGGIHPGSGALVASNSVFYGTTASGGENGKGTVFDLNASDQSTTVHSFGTTNASGVVTDGNYPYAGVTLSGGNLFGVTSSGGTNSAGVFYQVTPSGTFTALGSLLPAEGSPAVATLTLGGDGNFYGTGEYGGANADGALFSFTPGGTEKLLHAFSADASGTNSDGAYPSTSLLEGASRLFYGTAPEGGANGTGKIFTVTADGVTFTPLYSFSALNTNGTNVDGQQPGTLVKGSDGNFYGCAQFGGAHTNGTVFVITAAGALTVLHTFPAEDGNGFNADGASPIAPLLERSPGVFCGTAQVGGTSGQGTVFSLTVSPAVTSSLTAFAVVGSPFSYTIAATNGPTTFAADNLPAGLSLNPTTGVVSGTLSSSGKYTFKIGAQNAGGFDNETVTLTAILPPVPVITSVLSASVESGQPFSYTIVATNSPTAYTAGNLPAGLALNPSTGIISGAVSTVGTVTFNVGAQNPGGSDNETFTLTVTPFPKPVITSVLSASVQSGQLFSYTIVATNSPTTYAADNLPTGLNLNPSTGIISGTVSTVGTLTFKIGAQNQGGFDDETFTLTVTVPPPVVTSGNFATTVAGQPFSYQITGSNSPTAFGAGGLPDGLTVNATGLISGAVTTPGDYTVTLVVQNAAGSAMGFLSLIATPFQRQPTVTLTSPATDLTVSTGVTLPLAATVTDPDGVLKEVDFILADNAVATVTAAPFVANLQVPAPGTYTLLALARDIFGRQSSSQITLTVVSTPTVTLTVPTPVVQAGTDGVGEFLLTLSSVQDHDVVALLTVRGTAANGTDYTMLKTTRKIKAGKLSKPIKVIPLGDGGGGGVKRTVVLTLQPGNGYLVGTTGKVKVKIAGQGN